VSGAKADKKRKDRRLAALIYGAETLMRRHSHGAEILPDEDIGDEVAVGPFRLDPDYY